jgi:hypothetical protein
MMPPVVKRHHLSAASCVRDIIGDDRTQAVAEINALARIHLGITDLMARIRAEGGQARRRAPSGTELTTDRGLAGLTR